MLRKLINSVRFMRAFNRLVVDPTQLDVVFALGRHALAGTKLPDELRTPEVDAYVRAPQQNPRPLEVDFDELRACPQGSLGRAFADWLTAQGFKPNELTKYDAVHNQDDNEVVRYRTHLQSTHDLWHVLTGFTTALDGEIGLQAFYLAHLNSPLPLVTIAAAALNTLRARRNPAGLMEAMSHGWAMGKAARPLFGVDWASMWSMPLAEVRARYNITPVDAVSAEASAPAQAA